MMRLALAGAFLSALGVAILSLTTYGQASGLYGHQSCYHDLYFERELDAKVAVIGSSRIRRGLDPTIMAQKLQLSEGDVVNLGHPLSLPLLDHSILRDMFNDGRLGDQTKVLIVEVLPLSREQFDIERRGSGEDLLASLTISSGPVQDGFVSSASPRSLVELAKHDSPGALMTVWNAMRLFSARTEAHLKLAIRGRSTYEVFVPADDLDYSRDTICFADRWHQPGVGGGRAAQRKEHYRTNFDGRSAEGVLDPIDFLENPYYVTHRLGLRRVARLAEDEGVQIYGFYLPGVFTPDVPSDFPSRFEADIGFPLLTLPQDLREQLGEEGYFDHTHLTVAGRALVSEWLAQTISSDVTP